MKKTITILIYSLLTAAMANASVVILTLNGTDDRYGSGSDAGGTGTFDSVFNTGNPTAFPVGTSNSGSGAIRRAMQKWSIPTTIGGESITSGDQIESAILTMSVARNSLVPPSNLQVGQNLGINALVNPTVGNFNSSVNNIIETGVTPATVTASQDPVIVDIDITSLIKNEYDAGGATIVATIIFKIEDESGNFADTTRNYLLSGTNNANVPTLTITTVPEPSQAALGLAVIGLVAVAINNRRRK